MVWVHAEHHPAVGDRLGSSPRHSYEIAYAGKAFYGYKIGLEPCTNLLKQTAEEEPKLLSG